MDWTLPINSRSFGNLVNIDGPGGGIGTGGCRVPYQKMPGSSVGPGGPMAASSTFTLTSFDSDIGHGLKERESQTSLHHPHTHPHPHTHSHPHPHHYHAHVGGAAVGGGVVGGSGSATPQKHHQLHSSVTSIMPWKHRQCPSRGSSSSGTNSFRKYRGLRIGLFSQGLLYGLGTEGLVIFLGELYKLGTKAVSPITSMLVFREISSSFLSGFEKKEFQLLFISE